MAKMIEVRVKKDCKHGLLPVGYDPKALPKGAPGPKAVSGDVIKVTEPEIVSFGDKFDILDEAYKRKLEAKAAELAQD